VVKTVSISAFLRGTGKSNVVANAAAHLALVGRRVGVVDLDEAAPSQALLFGLNPSSVRKTLGDALMGDAAVDDAAYDVTPSKARAPGGALLLLPLAMAPGRLPLALRAGLDADRLSEMLGDFAARRSLDYLLLDTGSGLNEISLTAMAMSDAEAHVLRLEKRSYQGAAVTLDLARRLDVPRIALVVSMAPPALDPIDISRQLEETYNCPVAAVLPFAEEMAALGSASLFALSYPNHPLTAGLRRLVEWLA
jgi:MinD-like ATPase involved in chromosome partitioning or flagellar assembly